MCSRPKGTLKALYSFCKEEHRIQRSTDGSISVKGIRFEIPNQYRFIKKIWIRYKAWDLSSVYIIDKKSGKGISTIYPVDKHSNADGKRRPRKDAEQRPVTIPKDEVATLMKKYMSEFIEKGLPIPYLPKDENNQEKEMAAKTLL